MNQADETALMWMYFCSHSFYGDGWWDKSTTPNLDHKNFQMAVEANDQAALAKLGRFTAWKMKGKPKKK